MHRKHVLIIFVMCLVFVYSSYRLAHRYTFNDQVVNLEAFGTDTVEYQLMAVNIVDGHGITAHFIKDYNHYKIGVGKAALVNAIKPFKFFSENALINTSLHVWHPPGYPLFVALIYKCVGISPFDVKIIQLILLALAASFMPLIGFLCWGRMGAVSGVIASLVFINFYSPHPIEIRAEVLNVFLFSVWILLFAIWEGMPGVIMTALLGIILGLTLLVKGTCVFVAFFFLIYLFFRLKDHNTAIKHALVFFLAVMAMILPWSIYASIKTHQPVVLCTQTMPDLLAGNNAQSIQTGEWTPDWQTKTFVKERSDLKMLMVFLKQNYQQIPHLLANKLKAAFDRAAVVIGAMLCYYAASFYFKRMKSDQDPPVPIFPLMFFISIFLITVLSYGRYIIALPFIYPVLIPAAYLPFYLAKILYRPRS